MDVLVGKIKFSNNNNFCLIGGINVLEDYDSAINTAKYYKYVCNKLKINLVFKASYEKANRSSINSYIGPGLKDGILMLSKIKENLNIPIITDVHLPEEVDIASQVCDVIQLPAFLARQTSLIKAISKTKSVVNIKKPQFMSPNQLCNVVEKFFQFGKEDLLLCERGTSFGYDNLVVDFLGIDPNSSII